VLTIVDTPKARIAANEDVTLKTFTLRHVTGRLRQFRGRLR
jgi:hypothetical protein